MNQHDQQGRLEDILNDYVASTENPTRETLTEWVRRYPQYAKELVEFTANWALMEITALSEEDVEVDEEILTHRGMEVVQSILNNQHPEPQDHEEEAITNLIEEGKKLGLTQSEIATQIGLSRQMLLRLNRRLIRYSSIPTEVVNRIAKVLQRSTTSISSYLQGNPRLALGADYRAAQAPTIGNQQDFLDVVRDDTTMSDEQRKYWLDLEAKN